MKKHTGGSWAAGGFVWSVGIGCSQGDVDPDAVELNANSIADGAHVCACPNPGYVVRPDIGPNNSSWGGVNTATCGGPTQTMTVTFSGPALPTCATPPSGMVSWWPGEGDANDIQDGNDGTFNGTPAYSSGKVGQAFSFDGNTANYVFVPHNTNLDLTQFTVDAWIYPTSDSGIQWVVDKGDSTNGINYTLALTSDHHVEFDFAPPSVGHQSIQSTDSVPANAWTHITGSYDGTTSKLYINGVLNNSQT